jgi:hypothetical protein
VCHLQVRFWYVIQYRVLTTSGNLVPPQVGRLVTRTYPSYFPRVLVSQFRKGHARSCAQNHYWNIRLHSVAWNPLFKCHKEQNTKMRRKLAGCYRKYSKWLRAALKHASRLLRKALKFVSRNLSSYMPYLVPESFNSARFVPLHWNRVDGREVDIFFYQVPRLRRRGNIPSLPIRLYGKVLN